MIASVKRCFVYSINPVAFFVAVVSLSSTAHAQSPDFSSLTDIVDWDVVVTGVLSVAAASFAVDVELTGARLIMDFITDDPYRDGYYEEGDDGVWREYDEDGDLVGEPEDYED